MNDDISHWHLDKRVNVTHILATLTMVIALITWGGKLETRVALVEQRQEQQAAQQARDTNEIKEYLKEVRQDVKDIQRSIK